MTMPERRLTVEWQPPRWWSEYERGIVEAMHGFDAATAATGFPFGYFAVAKIPISAPFDFDFAALARLRNSLRRCPPVHFGFGMVTV